MCICATPFGSMCCEVIVFETVDDDTQKMSFFLPWFLHGWNHLPHTISYFINLFIPVFATNATKRANYGFLFSSYLVIGWNKLLTIQGNHLLLRNTCSWY